VAQLRKRYNAWYDDVSSTRPDNYAPPRIVVGTTHEPETWLTMQDLRAVGPGWGTSGSWPIRVEKAGTFRLEMHGLTPYPKGTSVTVGNGESKRSGALENGIVVVKQFRLSAGDHDLSAMVHVSRKTALPHQVRVTRETP